MINAEVDTSLEGSEIAIIGLACRFPGARTADEFWLRLRDGIELITLLSDEEIEPSLVDPANPADSNYVKAASMIDDVELFDASFFGIPPREAEVMDPQHRIFLECAWEALENAGYNSETFKGKIGLYAGARTNTYLFNLFTNRDRLSSLGAFDIGLGNDLAFLPTRVSYKLNLRGPSYAVHTACSTSLVAVHLACQSLLIDECQMALAGGIAINIPQKTGYIYQHGGITSPNGQCRAFDAQAQGTIFGSGVGIVVLKRLEDALAHGDYIHAVIRGSATNNDGAKKASFTAPSVYGQTDVIAEALANAGVGAETISYIEAHGTGTALGDPIEIRALSKAFQARTEKKGYCAIGSVKTNIGHLDAAAGVAGLIKTVLALKHRQIPATLHYQQANPNINFAETPFFVNPELREWESETGVRRAGVSSFGVGGTNAHVILEEAPEPVAGSESRAWQLLMVMAKSGAALEEASENLRQYLKQEGRAELADVAYTLQVGRSGFDHRRVVVCRDREDAVRALEEADAGRVYTSYREVANRPVVLLFPGQGAQYVNMGRGLYEGEAEYRREVDKCAEIVNEELGVDLRAILYPDVGGEESATLELEETRITQPALFVVEYALAKLWESYGVEAEAMLGHSLGEYVAACLAGVMSVEEALRLVVARGRLMQQVAGGAMLVAALSEEQARRYERKGVWLGAINGPKQVVLSGRSEAIAALAEELREAGIESKRLRTKQAFHSGLMEQVAQEYEAEVKKVKLRPPEKKYISNVTGSWIRAEEAVEAKYWVRQMVSAVRYAAGVEMLLSDSSRVYVEVGPGEGLVRLLRNQAGQRLAVVGQASLGKAAESDERMMATALGRLWAEGVEVDWQRYYSSERRRRVPLPTYPFQRQRYWIDMKDRFDSDFTHQAASEKKRKITDWFYVPSWKRSVSLDPAPIETIQAKNYLLFINKCNFGSAMADRLRLAKHKVTTVSAGERFVNLNDGAYAINPHERADYDALINELLALSQPPEIIIHLWNVTPAGSPLSGLTCSQSVHDLGFYSLMFLVQSLSDHGLTEPIQLSVVSNNLHEVTGTEVLQPEKALILGPGKVIQQEYSNISCNCIDIVLPESSKEDEIDVIGQVLSETSAKTDDRVIAYRGRHRWLQTFEPLGEKVMATGRSCLTAGGAYLITGGLGGVGLVVAKHLAASFRARLVLVGRSVLPPREEWRHWLETHDKQDDISQKITSVQELEAMGAEVLVFSANVSELSQMKSVVSQSLNVFGKINGVIHVAGVAGGGLMQIKTREIAENVLAPKVEGLLVLDTIFKDVDLDFMASFSSISAILGEFGQSDYCAANAFLDASANRRNGRFTVSINWDTWKDVGMTVAALDNASLPAELKERLRREIEKGMRSDEALDAFNRIMSQNIFPQVIVSTRDLQAAIENTRTFNQQRILESLAQTEGLGERHARPALNTDYAVPRDDSEQVMVNIWQELLGIDRVGIHDNFFDLGGHSLLATRLVARLRSAFNMDIPLDKLFASPTVAGLAHAIAEIKVEHQTEEQTEVLNILAQLSEEEIEAELKKRNGRVKL